MVIVKRKQHKINSGQKTKTKSYKKAGGRGSTDNKKTRRDKKTGKDKINWRASASCRRSGERRETRKSKKIGRGRKNGGISTSRKKSGRRERNKGVNATNSFVVLIVGKFSLLLLLALSVASFFSITYFFLTIFFIIILVLVHSHSLLDFIIITWICTGTPFTKFPLQVILGIRKTDF